MIAKEQAKRIVVELEATIEILVEETIDSLPDEVLVELCEWKYTHFPIIPRTAFQKMKDRRPMFWESMASSHKDDRTRELAFISAYLFVRAERKKE